MPLWIYSVSWTKRSKQQGSAFIRPDTLMELDFLGKRIPPKPQDRPGPDLRAFTGLTLLFYSANHLASNMQPAPVGQQLNHFFSLQTHH